VEILDLILHLVNLWALLGALVYSMTEVNGWDLKKARKWHQICGPIVWMFDNIHLRLHVKNDLEQAESLEKDQQSEDNSETKKEQS
jgi:hypothetical protein